MTSSDNPTLNTELEGYKRNGAPGEMHRGGAMKKPRAKRKRGGAMPEAFKEHDEKEKAKEHHKARKRGGKVEGKPPMHRPDKRARGGATDTADEHPMTSAGKMTKEPFERKEIGPDGGGEGPDSEGKNGSD